MTICLNAQDFVRNDNVCLRGWQLVVMFSHYRGKLHRQQRRCNTIVTETGDRDERKEDTDETMMMNMTTVPGTGETMIVMEVVLDIPKMMMETEVVHEKNILTDDQARSVTSDVKLTIRKMIGRI